MSNEDLGRYLIFTLGTERYGVPLLSIREVIALPEFTPIPQTPDYFMGIMNLRGQVISVLDLRKKLGIKPKAATSESPVIIFNIGALSLGVAVDAVESVVSPDSQYVSEKPALQNEKSHDYIKSIFRKENELILLIDITKALNIQDEAVLNQQNRKAA